MKRLLLPLLAALALPTAVNANVDPKVAEFCLKAADFAGCVKTMTSKSTDIPTTRMIDGGIELTGNSCPEGFAYAGAGICKDFPVNYSCCTEVDGFGLWAAGLVDRPNSWGWTGFGKETVRAVMDSKCPKVEPYLYTRSSCQSKPVITDMKGLKKGLKHSGAGNMRDPNRIKYWDNELKRVLGVDNLATDALNYKKPKSTPKKESSIGSVKINCDSPVWKNKPRCN